MTEGAVYPDPIVFPAKAEHKSTLIFLHGLGDSGQFFSYLAPKLSSSLPSTKFIFPTASKMDIPLNDGETRTAWYLVYDLATLLTHQDPSNLHASARYISSLIEKEVTSGTDSRKIVVAGHSQGGVMSLLTLRHKQELGAIVSVSGYLTLQDEPPLCSEANSKTAILMCHGHHDELVALSFGEKSYERLKAAGANVTFKSYPELGHLLDDSQLPDISAFLQQCLG